MEFGELRSDSCMSLRVHMKASYQLCTLASGTSQSGTNAHIASISEDLRLSVSVFPGLGAVPSPPVWVYVRADRQWWRTADFLVAPPGGVRHRTTGVFTRFLSVSLAEWGTPRVVRGFLWCLLLTPSHMRHDNGEFTDCVRHFRRRGWAPACVCYWLCKMQISSKAAELQSVTLPRETRRKGSKLFANITTLIKREQKVH